MHEAVVVAASTRKAAGLADPVQHSGSCSISASRPALGLAIRLWWIPFAVPAVMTTWPMWAAAPFFIAALMKTRSLVMKAALTLTADSDGITATYRLGRFGSDWQRRTEWAEVELIKSDPCLEFKHLRGSTELFPWWVTGRSWRSEVHAWTIEAKRLGSAAGVPILELDKVAGRS